MCCCSPGWTVEGDKPQRLSWWAFWPPSLGFYFSWNIVLWKISINDPHLRVTKKIRLKVLLGDLGESSQSNKLWKGEGKKEPGPREEWVMLVWSAITETGSERECVPVRKGREGREWRKWSGRRHMCCIWPHVLELRVQALMAIQSHAGFSFPSSREFSREFLTKYVLHWFFKNKT